MRRIFTTTAVAAALLVPATAASAGIPTPDPMAANCHGRAMGIGSSMYKGPANYGRMSGMSTLDAHYAFMDMQGCHSE
jgi:hypothetical protein